jgi:hypothetical protein
LTAAIFTIINRDIVLHSPSRGFGSAPKPHTGFTVRLCLSIFKLRAPNTQYYIPLVEREKGGTIFWSDS